MDDGYMVCARVCEHLGEMDDFVGYQSEEWDPKSQPDPACLIFFFFFQSSSGYPNVPVRAKFEKLSHQ